MWEILSFESFLLMKIKGKLKMKILMHIGFKSQVESVPFALSNNVFSAVNEGQISGIGIPFFHIHIGGILTPIRYLNWNHTISKISLSKDAHVIQPSNQQ